MTFGARVPVETRPPARTADGLDARATGVIPRQNAKTFKAPTAGRPPDGYWDPQRTWTKNNGPSSSSCATCARKWIRFGNWPEGSER